MANTFVMTPATQILIALLQNMINDGRYMAYIMEYKNHPDVLLKAAKLLLTIPKSMPDDWPLTEEGWDEILQHVDSPRYEHLCITNAQAYLLIYSDIMLELQYANN